MAKTQFLPPPLTPTTDHESSTSQQLYEPVLFETSADIIDGVLTAVQPVDSEGTEAKVSLSSTMTSEHKPDTATNAYGKDIVIEKDVVCPTAIVSDNSKL